MNALKHTVFKSIILLSGVGLANVALAGRPGIAGTITTVPGASGIPTMGGGALMMLSVLLAVIAVRVMRSGKHKAVNMTVALAAILSLVSGAGGVHLISDAIAGEGITINNPNGATRSVFPGFNQVRNESGVLQRVSDISLNSDCSQVFDAENGGGKDSVGDCSVSPSSEIPDGRSCDLIIDCGDMMNGGIGNGGNGGFNGGLNGGVF